VPHERDERWVYVALAVLAIAYVVYKFGPSVDLPSQFPRVKPSFHGLGKVLSTVPYLAATLIGVFFQFWGRRKRAEARKHMEAQLVQEGPIRQGQAITVRVGRRLGSSYDADLHLTRAALYVLDTTGKRDPLRIPLRRSEGAFVEDASIVPAAGDGYPTVIVTIGGPARKELFFTSPEATAWWMDVRKALGKSAEMPQEAMTDHVETEASSRKVETGEEWDVESDGDEWAVGADDGEWKMRTDRDQWDIRSGRREWTWPGTKTRRS
jgi:hypothetical protein